jgi:hypothetical protein
MRWVRELKICDVFLISSSSSAFLALLRARVATLLSASRFFHQPVDSSGNCGDSATLQPHVADQFHFFP